jgi:nucleoside 2-deoxyribosyltransferase
MKVITICGSGRHREAIYETARLLNEAGLTVLAPPLHQITSLCEGQPAELHELAWKGATHAHLNRIVKADVVYVVNPDGYIGSSTTLELGYAIALRKLVVAMVPDRDELARTILFDVILNCADTAKAAEQLVDRVAGRSRSTL